jgi:hypothetical protein
LARVVEAAEVSGLGHHGHGRDEADAAHGLDGLDHGRQRPGGDKPADLILDPGEPGRGVVDRVDVFLQHDLVGGMLKAQAGEPDAVLLRPVAARPEDPVVAQREARELLAGAAQAGQQHGIAPVGLDPVAGARGRHRWRDQFTVVAHLGQLAMNAMAAGVGFIAEMQRILRLAQLRHQLADRLSRVAISPR